MIKRFFRHFGHPVGALGWVAGALMARKNQPVNRWVLGLASVQSDEQVIELGCGPGALLQLLAQRVDQGRVVGIDASPVMAASAARRNAKGVREGRVEVLHTPVESLPLPSDQFNAACSVNSLPHWTSPKDGLREVHRVLAPGGRVVLALRMRSNAAGKLSAAAYGSSEEGIGVFCQALAEAGFEDIETVVTTLGEEATSALLASRPR